MLKGHLGKGTRNWSNT